MKHTPGLWISSINPFDQSVEVYSEVKTKLGDFQMIASCDVLNVPQEEREANAALIAAAPDLLEALKLCAPLLQVHNDGPWLAASTKAMDAILKAIGDAI